MVKRNKMRIIVIAGPTASGKSDMAIALATQFGGEIISADSRQVYRRMDIGTGKVTRDKIRNKNGKWRSLGPSLRSSRLRTSYFSQGIRHWLLDVASPKQQYTVVQWRKAAQEAVSDIVSRGLVPIVAGGTGFYIDALVYGMSLPEVLPDPKLRAKLEKKTTTQLVALLKHKDPRRARTIDHKNRRRLIRALEIILSTGKPVPRATRHHPYEIRYVAIDAPIVKLKKRIEVRLDARLRGGMVTEVKKLHARGVSWRRMDELGLEYRHLARYLQGKYEVRSKHGEARKPGISSLAIPPSPFQAMRSALLGDIVSYARRQMTWWRRNKDTVWVRNQSQAMKLAREFLS